VSLVRLLNENMGIHFKNTCKIHGDTFPNIGLVLYGENWERLLFVATLNGHAQQSWNPEIEQGTTKALKSAAL
jgi:hypothetical protein